MPIGVRQYWTDAQPVNLLSLVDKDVLLHLLNGFTYAIGAGVSVLFPSSLPANSENMQRLDARGDIGVHQFFHPFCRAYRGTRANDLRCMNYDASVATKYYSGDWADPAVYRCYMQLWEMTFPLVVHGQLFGVLSAGQIIVKGENLHCRESLRREGACVRWETVTDGSGSQVADVCAALPQYAESSLREELDAIVRSDPEHKNVDMATLLLRWRKFRQFGNMMTSLLAQLYEQRMSGAKERILNQIGIELIAHTTAEESWWETLSQVTHALQEIAGIEGIDVYAREGSRYVQKIVGGKVVGPEAARRVPVRICVSIPTETLAPILDLSGGAELQKAFGLTGNGHVYKCDYEGLHIRSISTVFVLRDHIASDETREFAAAFCHRVGLRADLRELLFQIDTDRRLSSDQARRAAHASRTPLQVALSDIELAELAQERGTVPDYPALVGRVKERILDCETEISEILARVPRPRRVLDLRDLLTQLAEAMKPLANRKNCRITIDLPARGVPVKVSEPEIRNALRNLLDNAIKYSYADHEVRVHVTVVSRSSIVVFDNYGVGIPEERLRAIREIGERGGVFDPVRERSGFGVGLSAAVMDIEAHGGSLDIDSAPADPDPRWPGLRFITKVTVILPLAGR